MNNYDELYWRMGKRGLQDFFEHFSIVQIKSLQLTREVLQEREWLKVTIDSMQPLVRAKVAKIDELQHEKQLLKQHEADMIVNKDFIYTVKLCKQRKIDLRIGEYTTNCLKCNYTCHQSCICSDAGDLFNCSAMSNNSGSQYATCGVCPGRCSWRNHACNSYRFELYEGTETRTSNELKARYESAKSGKEKVEAMITKMEEKLQEMDQAILQRTEQAKQSIQHLQEIALKPDHNSVHVVEYIDLIIESEKQEARPGWSERVSALLDIRKHAETLLSV